tara:strand:- start:10554 stop:11084 length:531 start_codon:yes stop_codon:yes gene_type:complete
VARAEPTSKVTRLANGHAAQVRADTQHDEPFGLLDAVRVGLRVAQGFPFGVFCFFDFRLGAVADEDGLAAPFDNDLCRGLVGQVVKEGKAGLETYVLALGDGGEIDFDLGLGEHVGGRRHVDEEVCCGEFVSRAFFIVRWRQIISKIANCSTVAPNTAWPPTALLFDSLPSCSRVV